MTEFSRVSTSHRTLAEIRATGVPVLAGTPVAPAALCNTTQSTIQTEQETINMGVVTGISPGIFRQHPQLDAGQLEIIGHLDGPALGIAGPGAGKTLAIALMGANVVLEGWARPEEVVLCTYNRYAARELRQRFMTLATAAGYRGNPERVRVCTIHSLCHQLLQPHSHRVGLGPAYRLLNEVEQHDFMLERFEEIFGPSLPDLRRRGWQQQRAVVNNARRHFDRIADELIDPRDLLQGESDFLAALGCCYARYLRLLRQHNLVDFAHLQVWADALLQDDRIARKISGGIRHLMCDEYQDTSRVQEQVLLRLTETHGNL